MVAATHQAEFDLVLHVFDVEGAAARAGAHQGADYLLGQAIHSFAHTGRGSALGTMHRQKGLHHGHSNLVGLKRHHGAVTANDLVMVQRVALHIGDRSLCCMLDAGS